MLYRLAVEGELLDALRVDVGVELFKYRLEQYDEAGNLHSTSGASGACPHEHEHDEDCPARSRPQVEVGG